MTHLEIENLASDYLEGLLDPSLRTAVEAHLSGLRGLPRVDGGRPPRAGVLPDGGRFGTQALACFQDHAGHYR